MKELGIADGSALGGSVRLVVTRLSRLGLAWSAVERRLRQIDLAASRFRQDSELSRINAHHGGSAGPLLAQAIQEALRGALITGGAVDPTVGAAVRLAGYDVDFASVPSDGGPLEFFAERVPGWQAVQFDAVTGTVLMPLGVELDLGATAKALAADLCAADALAAAASGGVLVSLGGDIAVAGEPPEGGWPIQVSESSAARISSGEETITITSGGLATSSTTVRRWTRAGVVLHHIIDPRTGRPAAGPWRTATTVAGTCVDANIASTAAIVLGEEAHDWLVAQAIPARLVGIDGRVARVGNWPDPEQAPSGLSANSQESGSRLVS
jgi:thiamine biosynthesis lipoprotein